MKEYIAQPNYEYELTELTEPGKLCGLPGVFVKKYDCARAIVKAREEGRRDGLEDVRKIMTYDETATSRGLGQGNTWDVIKRTYTIDADVFDALLAEGKKEQSDE